jgi:hypothetical protein
MCLLVATASTLLLSPAVAFADLEDDIIAVFDEYINGLTGAEISGLEVEGQVVTDDVYYWKVTVLGFAFCYPADPWAPPTPSPDPPYGVYECQSAADVDVVVTPGEDGADVLITIDPVFLDLVLEREWGLCPWWEAGSGSPVIRDAYLLVDATIAATLQLDFTGECVRATLVPGSLQVTLGENTREMTVNGDGCVDFWLDILAPSIWHMLGPMLADAFEEVIEDQMAGISDSLCDLTPVESGTWGSMKALFRPATEGDGE